MIRTVFFPMLLIFALACSGSKNHVQNKQKVFQSTTFKNVKIYESENGAGPCEPSIYINPADPDNIVAGSVINFVHVSEDGGTTWKTASMQSPLGVWGDPCIVAGPEGDIYYLHLSDPEGTNWRSEKILDRIVVQRSGDGGKTWSSGSGIGENPPRQQDKEWATVHPKTGEVYVTWTEFDRYGSHDPKDKSRILFSSSSDKGSTWTKAVAINQFDGNTLDDDRTVEGAVPAVANNGHIYVAWAYDEKIYFDKSTDNGKTWLKEDIVITSQPEGWNLDIPGLGRCNGMPVTCVDNSNGPHSGTVYVNWADQRNGTDNTDIFIAKSADGGITWSEPLKVNADATRTHQFFTWMSVDPGTGYIYIVYYDRSRYSDNRTDVVLSVSYDGGEHFVSKTISESPFTPVSSVFFGDYNNIHAHNGRIRPVWTRYENGKLSVWTALVNEE
ncbi:MAG: exo-alpha-sialidase [Sinomicrobium sp.]|nr:exo-alpha-sialidase [Sinomicrobium sp.]